MSADNSLFQTMKNHKYTVLVASSFLFIACINVSVASERHALTARYERAQKLLQGFNSKSITFNTTVYPIWIGQTDTFWYERELKNGKEYRLVNARRATNTIAFDHNALAKALAAASKHSVDPVNLPISKVEISTIPQEIQFQAFDKQWIYEQKSNNCREISITPEEWVVSPDGKYAAFSRDYNIWVVNTQSGKEQALTLDGEEFFVYGAAGTAWGVPNNDEALQVRWSPDSKRLLTVRRDTRRVKNLPVVHHVPNGGSMRPKVESIKVAYPGDKYVETLRVLAIDIESGQIKEADYPQIPTTRNGLGLFTMGLGWWAKDSRRSYFVDVDRYYKYARVIEFDTHTGTTSILVEEVSNTQLNMMLNSDERPTLLPLPESEELLWFSERSGWGHLYLYDLRTGKLKNPVSKGHWVVRGVIRFDAKHREVYVQTAGRVKDRDPYYRDVVGINIDTGKITTLASGNYDYFAAAQTEMQTEYAIIYGQDAALSNAISPTGNFAVVTQSKVNEVPISFLFDRDGRKILEIERADITGLPDDWQWPEPVKLIAADGETPLYGVIFRPSDFSPEKSYPVINNVFNTPELSFVPKGSFTNTVDIGRSYLSSAALAEIGFIVVQIDGRGVSLRSKELQDESYGWIESASNLDDHVAGIKQLADRYPYMDLDRVGIVSLYGGPGGVQGLLQYPDFYKVGVSHMPHDSRMMAATMWGDKYESESGPNPYYQYPEELADKLRGKLLLTHGMLNSVVPPATVFRIVEALQKANRDFDMLLMPNLGHQLSSYLTRRSWDYLIRHLIGIKPPKEFWLKTHFSDRY